MISMFGKQCVAEKYGVPLGVRLNDIDIEAHFRTQNERRAILIRKLKLAE